MRTRSRRAPLLAACAFALAASFSAKAEDYRSTAAMPVAKAPAEQPRASIAATQSEKLAAELAAFEKTLIRHVKGEELSTFDALDGRRKELKAQIEAAGLAPADKKVLDARLGRAASVIARSRRLSGGGASLDPEVSKAVAGTGVAAVNDPLSQIDALLGDLNRAAANPAEADKIFDNLRDRYGASGGASGAIRVNFDAIRETISYTPKGAPGTNDAKARNLARGTPAPAADSRDTPSGEQVNAPYQLKVDRVNADGSIELDLQPPDTGWTRKGVSPHVWEILRGKKRENWDVDVSGLPPDRGPKRRQACLSLAQEVLKSVGEPDEDGVKAKAFADFLNTAAFPGPNSGALGNDPMFRLTISAEAHKVYTLIAQQTDGTRGVLTGFFGVIERGKAELPVFRVQNEVQFDAKWGMTGAENPEAHKRALRVAQEYLGDGTRIVRGEPTSELVDRYRGGDWNPLNYVANKNEVRRREYTREKVNESTGKWAKTHSGTGAPEVTEKEGTSPVILGAQGLVSLPVLKQTLQFSNGVSVLLTSQIVERGIGVFRGQDIANLNQVASNSRDWVWTRNNIGREPDWATDPNTYEEKLEAWAIKILSKLTPGARKILDARALEMRSGTMAIARSDNEVYYDKAMAAKLTDVEAYYALSEFGWGTHGKQLARGGHLTLGAIVSGGEAATDMVTNPLTWALPYAFSQLGKASVAMESRAAIASASGAARTGRALTVGSKGATAVKGLLAGAVGVPFVLDASHTFHEAIAKFNTPEGAVAAGRAVVDGIFIYGIGLSLGDTAPGRKLAGKFMRPDPPVTARSSPLETAPEAVSAKAPVQLELFMPDGSPTSAAAVKGPSAGVFARMKSGLIGGLKEFYARGGDAWKEKSLEELKNSDVKAPTRAEPNTASGEAPFGAQKTEAVKPGEKGEQLEFESMKVKPEEQAALAKKNEEMGEATLAEGQRRTLRANDSAAGGKGPETRPGALEEKTKIPSPERPSRLRRLTAQALKGGHYGLATRVLPPAVIPTPSKIKLPEEKVITVPSVPPDPSAPTVVPTSEQHDIKPPRDNGTDRNPGGSPGGGGSAAGGSAAASPSGKGPSAPKFDGGGGGKGGGGGGPAGNGVEGGGGKEMGGGGSGPALGGPAVSAAPPAGLRGGGPMVSANPGAKAARNDAAPTGGHSPSPSLAGGFDGSRPRAATANNWSPTGMRGLGGGDSSGMPRLMPRQPSLSAPSSSDGGPVSGRSAGSYVGGPAQAGAPAAKPEEEDFTYTSMAPARHKYELPEQRPADKKDWRYLLSLGLRGAAALAISYLIYHSELPYLVGFTRRRRDGTYGA